MTKGDAWCGATSSHRSVGCCCCTSPFHYRNISHLIHHETMSAPFSYNTYDSLPDAPKFELTSDDITEGGTMPPPQLSKGCISCIVSHNELLFWTVLILLDKLIDLRLPEVISYSLTFSFFFHFISFYTFQSIWCWRWRRCISVIKLEGMFVRCFARTFWLLSSTAARGARDI